MMKRQNELNEKTIGESWHLKGLNFRRHVMLEGAELMNSMKTKWWKDEKIDVNNARLEVIDMLHFALSIHIEEGHPNASVNRDYVLHIGSLKDVDGIDNNDVLMEVEDTMLACLTIESGSEILSKVFSLCGTLHMDDDDILKLYLGKGVLNRFRQDHGYKDGSYEKMWNGEEDNVYMMHVIDDMVYDDNFEEELQNHLTYEYTMYV